MFAPHPFANAGKIADLRCNLLNDTKFDVFAKARLNQTQVNSDEESEADRESRRRDRKIEYPGRAGEELEQQSSAP